MKRKWNGRKISSENSTGLKEIKGTLSQGYDVTEIWEVCIETWNTHRMERTDLKEPNGLEKFNSGLRAGPLPPRPRQVTFKTQAQICVAHAGAGQSRCLRITTLLFQVFVFLIMTRHFLMLFDKREMYPH